MKEGNCIATTAGNEVRRVTRAMSSLKIKDYNRVDTYTIVDHDMFSQPPEYSGYSMPSKDSMTEEQKHFSEHYPLHVYFKVDELRLPTLEEAIREHELSKAALSAHQEGMSMVSGQTQALLDRCLAAEALLRHPRSWAERAHTPGAMRTSEEKRQLERQILEQRYYHDLRYLRSSKYHRINARRFREMHYEDQKAASQPDIAFETRIRELVASHTSSSLHAPLDIESTSTNNVFTLAFR